MWTVTRNYSYWFHLSCSILLSKFIRDGEVREEEACYKLSRHFVKALLICICYTYQSPIYRHFYHVYGILLVLYLPLIHRIDQAPPLLNRDRQRAQHSHSHSRLLLPLQKSGRITRVESPVLTLTAIHSQLVLDSCYHQTEHVSTDLWVLIPLSVCHHTLPRKEKWKKWAQWGLTI